jgi:hypothetical protein
LDDDVSFKVWDKDVVGRDFLGEKTFTIRQILDIGDSWVLLENLSLAESETAGELRLCAVKEDSLHDWEIVESKPLSSCLLSSWT